MKALFVGAGSIGKRHIKDFYLECKQNNCPLQTHVLRRTIGDLGEIQLYVDEQLTELRDDYYDVAFITNPTNLHYEALLKCKNRVQWYFIEKPIFDDTNISIQDLGINDENSYIAAPMRHTMTYKKLKEIANEHRVFSARVICSSYLPMWRKGIDYRTVYSAHKEMGGGVNLDLIHEIDYIYDLFGMPDKIYGKSGKYSDLEINSNDLSAYILDYGNKICEIHLDYFGKKSIRTCELYTTEGTFTADFYKEKILLPDDKVIDCHVANNEEYANEMHYFYEFINGRTSSINPPSKALKTLRIALNGD